MIATITIQNSPRLDELNSLIDRYTTSASKATLKINSLIVDGLEFPLGKVRSKWYSKDKNRLTLKIGE